MHVENGRGTQPLVGRSDLIGLCYLRLSIRKQIYCLQTFRQGGKRMSESLQRCWFLVCLKSLETFFIITVHAGPVLNKIVTSIESDVLMLLWQGPIANETDVHFWDLWLEGSLIFCFHCCIAMPLRMRRGPIQGWSRSSSRWRRCWALDIFLFLSQCFQSSAASGGW